LKGGDKMSIQQDLLLNLTPSFLQTSSAGGDMLKGIIKAQDSSFDDIYQKSLNNVSERKNASRRNMYNNNDIQVREMGEYERKSTKSNVNNSIVSERKEEGIYNSSKTEIRHGSVSKISADSEGQSFDGIEEKDINEERKNIILESLAGLLGMEVGQLKEILEQSGVSPEALAEPSGLQNAVDRLGDFLGLDILQKDTLLSLAEEVNIQAGKLMNAEPGAKAAMAGKEDWVIVKDAVLEKIDHAEKHIAISSEIKMKAEQLKQKLNQSLEKSDEKTLSQLTPETQEAESMVPASEKRDSGKSPESSTGNESIEGLAENNISRSEDKAFPENNFKDGQFGGDLKFASEAGDRAENGEEIQFSSVIGSQQLNNTESTSVLKADRGAPVQKQEIIRQIIDKAKVLLDGDKSEMVVDLKPDHLGKLSLKVVTENGIVAAKIMAENQQVKQILESNMQLLKDSLEKQGMVVQDFSVTVGQNSSYSTPQRENRGKQRQGQTSAAGGIVSARALGGTERFNPYEWSESSIDLTA